LSITPTVECLASTVTVPSTHPDFSTTAATLAVMSTIETVRPVSTLICSNCVTKAIDTRRIERRAEFLAVGGDQPQDSVRTANIAKGEIVILVNTADRSAKHALCPDPWMRVGRIVSVESKRAVEGAFAIVGARHSQAGHGAGRASGRSPAAARGTHPQRCHHQRAAQHARDDGHHH